MRNIKLTLKFSGTAFHGWQIQKNALTIQECMQKAILLTTGEHVNVIGCGRTDSGVHANMYVCSFYTNSTIPSTRFPYALNTKLPQDIVCMSGEEVDCSFHAGKSAISKQYVYKIYNSEFPNPFYNNYCWFIREKLNLSDMLKAAGFFIGEHDFVGFASSGYTVKTTVRTIYSLEIEQENNIISIKVTGNGFLYNMVRIISGTLVYVGMGRIKADDIPQIINSRDRKMAGITAPPDGLYLWEVNY